MKAVNLSVLSFLFIGILTFPIYAQVGISNSQSNPHPSSMLDIVSNSKGILIPRMTSQQRQDIVAPGLGLMVYDVNAQAFYYHNGEGWLELLSNLYTSTDNQSIDVFQLNGNQLELSISGDNEATKSVNLSPLAPDLDKAYDQGGPGNGRIIHADNGAVEISGTDGLTITGTKSQGQQIAVTGAGTRMLFNPFRAAFRTGTVDGNQWNHSNLGSESVAMGRNSIASGNRSFAVGDSALASGLNSVAMGAFVCPSKQVTGHLSN